MLVFVDESGDQGLLKKFGSSGHFVISAVIFADSDDAYACSSRIGQLRTEWFQDARPEFKFNKCSRDYRCRFLEEMRTFEFLYCATAIDKSAIYSSELQMQRPFYRFASKLLFETAKRYLLHAKVTIDGSGDRDFRLQLQNYLRSKINTETKIIDNVRVESSITNNLLQLADMVCGSVARSLRTEKPDRFLYRRILLRKELEVVHWPKQ